MASIHSLTPISEAHSIKEAVITFFLASKLFKPERYNSLLNSDFKDDFRQFEIVKRLQIKMQPGSSEIREVEDAGFKFVGFDTSGRKSKVIQGINEDNRSFFSFHSLQYSDWKDFSSSVKNHASSLTNIQKGLYVMAYSLHYIDEFNWSDKNDFDAGLIFKDSEYIPKDIRNASILDYNMNLDKKDNGKNYFDRLGIKFQDQMTQKLITISHNITFITEQDPILLEDAVKDNNMVISNLEYAHDKNKNLLRDILKDEVLVMIKLQKI